MSRRICSIYNSILSQYTKQRRGSKLIPIRMGGRRIFFSRAGVNIYFKCDIVTH